MRDLTAHIRSIPDFPKPGIMFRDITPLLANGPAWRACIDRLAERYQGRVDTVVGIDARGFLVGGALAYSLGCGLTVVRKSGKLPAETLAADYGLEYGTDRLEIHRDAFAPGSRVLLVDDLLATGGTARAALGLIQQLEGEVVEVAFLVELLSLGGRQNLVPHEAFALMQFE
ncbi:MAG: adenine phosphoribosyltransferase [Desulfurellaceae bacterium]|nr:adenine phosphoribosyltransferase [Desulfurellaceae bacterium]